LAALVFLLVVSIDPLQRKQWMKTEDGEPLVIISARLNQNGQAEEQ